MDLVKIIKDCPHGTKLYSPLVGVVEFDSVDDSEYPINVYFKDNNNEINFLCFTKEGLRFSYAPDGECMLWPSKEVRTWDNFKVKKPKFDPKTLMAFDRVLAKHKESHIWFPDFYSFHIEDRFATVGKGYYSVIIPYNEETKHLVGTTEEAPEFYRYWED